MILVAGGTGTLGTLLVRSLTQRDTPVRVLTRDPARARHLHGAHLEVVEGDIRDSADVARAVVGASATARHGVQPLTAEAGAVRDRTDRRGVEIVT